MSNPVWETMTYIKTIIYRVRVWRETSLGEIGPDIAVKEVIHDIIDKKGGYPSIRDIIDIICQLDRISAVEVVNRKTKHGVVFYPDWK